MYYEAQEYLQQLKAAVAAQDRIECRKLQEKDRQGLINWSAMPLEIRREYNELMDEAYEYITGDNS